MYGVRRQRPGRKCHPNSDVSINDQYSWTGLPLCVSSNGPNLFTNVVAERVSHLSHHFYSVHVRVLSRDGVSDEPVGFIDSSKMFLVSLNRRNTSRRIDNVSAELTFAFPEPSTSRESPGVNTTRSVLMFFHSPGFRICFGSPFGLTSVMSNK